MALIGHLQVANKCRIASAILTAASSGPIPKAPGSAGGYLSSGTKTETIARARQLIATVAPVQTAHQPQPPDSAPATDKATHPCPYCGGRMNIIETFNRGSTPQYRPPPPTVIRIDTS